MSSPAFWLRSVSERSPEGKRWVSAKDSVAVQWIRIRPEWFRRSIIPPAWPFGALLPLPHALCKCFPAPSLRAYVSEDPVLFCVMLRWWCWWQDVRNHWWRLLFLFLEPLARWCSWFEEKTVSHGRTNVLGRAEPLTPPLRLSHLLIASSYLSVTLVSLLLAECTTLVPPPPLPHWGWNLFWQLSLSEPRAALWSSPRSSNSHLIIEQRRLLSLECASSRHHHSKHWTFWLSWLLRIFWRSFYS